MDMEICDHDATTTDMSIFYVFLLSRFFMFQKFVCFVFYRAAVTRMKLW